mmetsp:Transcript_3734/g.8447  ORF Transcript_3734/g.8447 Transcript_3734/m.8447 type:complete len:88 (+) Transcript_3734:78-341(+)
MIDADSKTHQYPTYAIMRKKKTRKTIKSSAAHSAGTSTLDIPLLFMLEITAARNSATPYPGFGLLAMQRVILLFHLACHTLQAELVD